MDRAKEGDVKTEILGFFILATVASFYPTRESISYSSVNAVTEQDVFDMVEKLIQFAKEDTYGGSEIERAVTLAYRIESMQERGTSDGKSMDFRDFFVRNALGILSDYKYVLERKGESGEETTYVASSVLRDLVLERLNGSTLQMAEILNRYHDHVDMNSVE